MHFPTSQLLLQFQILPFEAVVNIKDIFNRYYVPLCNYAYLKTANHVDAKDLVQNNFLRLLSSKLSNSDEDTLKFHLFKALKYGIIDHQLKNTKMRLSNDFTIAASDDSESDNKELEEVILKDQILQSIRPLPPKYQDTFVLSKIHGYTYQEIANELDISIKTVEAQMTKSFKILREKLNKILQ